MSLWIKHVEVAWFVLLDLCCFGKLAFDLLFIIVLVVLRDFSEKVLLLLLLFLGIFHVLRVQDLVLADRAA